ncbi:uncharacterized protein LOC111869076 isoform X2 [Cryptotermes secundus]|uniref:uncharacterized protein LOC111869076 isoform X2 n=1 Tax=Cryptotermes secundus TaxID=105785 RepID=UPI001454E2AC|nr:uncharacterized protein LOC111869076 isoform X2 [Cryptotermes secundus]
METELEGQNVATGVSSPDISEINNFPPLKKTEPSSQNSRALLKSIAKTRSGSVKLGSFKFGGKKKINSEEDSRFEVKETKKKAKTKKERMGDNSDRQESESSAASTPSPGNKQSIPSKASSLVRKLSIGKYKASGSRKAVKSADTPSSQDEYQSFSTEEESVVSPSVSSAATSQEVSATPNQDAAAPIDQWTIIKGSKSDSSFADSSTPTTPGITDSLPVLESTSQEEIDGIVNGKNGGMIVSEAFLSTSTNSDVKNLAEVRTCDFESGKSEDDPIANSNGDVILPTHYCDPVSLSPVCKKRPFADEDRLSKHEAWFIQFNEDEGCSSEGDTDNRPTTKDKILTITTPLMMKQQDFEEHWKQLDSEVGNMESLTSALSAVSKDVGKLPVSVSEKVMKMKYPSEYTNMLSAVVHYRMRMLEQKAAAKHEHLYKILVIGELGTGKTSIIKRYVHQFFSQHYRATIGVDFALKVLNWDANTIVRLQLWDIAGQERFGNMTRVYYKEAVGAFIVFDVTRAATFDAVVKWKQDLDAKVQLPDGSAIPCVLLANKCDQPKEGLVNNPSKMDEYCKERGFTAWFETSAKDNINIEDAAKCLVSKILQNNKMINSNESSNDLERFTLDGRNQREQKSKTCGC